MNTAPLLIYSREESDSTMLTVRKEDDMSEQLPYYTGNVQLMEARFLELSSSIRALYKSNQDLEDALQECPGDADFMQAIIENEDIIVKQRKELIAVVRGMQELGANVDVPDDIQTMDVTFGSATQSTSALTPTEDQDLLTATTQSEDYNNQRTSSGEEQGVYL